MGENEGDADEPVFFCLDERLVTFLNRFFASPSSAKTIPIMHSCAARQHRLARPPRIRTSPANEWKNGRSWKYSKPS
jgi:hypothetical protein